MKKIFLGVAMLALAGCAQGIQYGEFTDYRKGHAPQTLSLVQASERVGATKNSPVLIRIFKESNELEFWRKTASGEYALVHTFSVCAYSGELGPKKKLGDRQSPEGFYSTAFENLNFNSIRYLSFNTGYPNEYDRAHGRSGGSIMIHGGCDSSGCFAIKDVPMQDLFAAIRDSLKAGQKMVQIHMYPFRMNEFNMLAHSKNPNMDFWKQLKVGYDKFEVAHKELNVSVVNKRYVVK
jgi:hypothetical protein